MEKRSLNLERWSVEYTEGPFPLILVSLLAIYIIHKAKKIQGRDRREGEKKKKTLWPLAYAQAQGLALPLVKKILE